MVLGVIMLSAISYVTLSTGERPFRAIMHGVSPVLAWAWIVATLMANIVWCMPQFALGTAAITQNLAPGLSAEGGPARETVWIIGGVLFSLALLVNFLHESKGKGFQVFDMVLKAMVALVVVSFFAVIVALSLGGQLPWGKIFAGFVPNLDFLSKAAPELEAIIERTGAGAEYWRELVVKEQRDVMMTAFGTAVGINMTFLLPYSMLRRRWGRAHRGIAIFDLGIGLVLPFVLATGCIIMAAASQFHANSQGILDEEGLPLARHEASFNKNLNTRLSGEFGEGWALMDDGAKEEARAGLGEADRQMAAALVRRDNLQLADALKPFAGDRFSQIIFGVGVFGMALSTIIILMLINGFTFCEIFNRPGSRAVHMTGAVVAGVAGMMGPLYLWKGASQAALAIPTSVIGGSMIPIAYFTFLLLMNSRKILGESMPRGGRRLLWNLLMLVATVVGTAGSIWVLLGKFRGGDPSAEALGARLDYWVGLAGLILIPLLLVVGLIGYIGHQRGGGKEEV